MIPIGAIYLFIFVVGISIGWITTHCIIGYKYEKYIRDELQVNQYHKEGG